MSLQTWKEEFYHREPSKRMTTLEAIDHSLLKWEGRRKENLEKHGLINSDTDMIIEKDSDGYSDDETFMFDGTTCALCVKFFDHRAPDRAGACNKCPLYKSGHAPCITDSSIYHSLMWGKMRGLDRGLEAMIDQLRETLVWQLERE